MAKTNKGRKFFATTATAALVASAIVPVASAAQVNDYNSISPYAQEAVQALVDSGVIQGDEKGNFNPKKTVTRAEAATILTKALELSSTSTVNFTDVAVGAWYYEAVAAAVNAGIFEGQGAGKFNPSGNLTRSEAAIILVEAFGLEGSASLAQFSDAASVKSWAQEALEIAVANGVIKGDNGKLNPNAPIVRQDFALMYNRTEVAADEAAVVEVASLKAINSTTLEVTLAEAQTDLTAANFKITVGGTAVTPTSVTADATGAKYTIVHADLDGTKGTVSVNGVTADFDYTVGKVESVTATNLKEVVVTFNRAVDKESAEEKGNYALKSGKAIKSVTLSEDAKSVVVTLADGVTLNNNRTEAISVSNVKAGDKTVSGSNIEFKVFDNEIPEVTGVTSLGTKAVKVTFSEPVNNVKQSNFTLDGKAFYGKVNVVGNEVVLTPYSTTALAVGDHSLQISQIADFAGFTSITSTKDFTVVEDKDAPKVAETAATLETLTITFSEDVDPDTIDKAKVYWKSGDSKKAAASVEQLAGNKFKYTFTGENTLPSGSVAVYIEGVKDYSGNSIAADTKVVVTPEIDQTRPEVKKVEAVGATTIEVTFSKVLEATSAKNRNNYTVTNKDGKVISVKDVTLSADGKTATVELYSSLSTGDNKLTIKNVKDSTKLQNTMLDYSEVVTVKDTKKPTIDSKVWNTSDRRVVVKFSEKMDIETLADYSNYIVVVNGQARTLTSAIADLEVVQDGTAVVITFVEKIGNTTVSFGAGSVESLQLLALKDAAGNLLNEFTLANGSNAIPFGAANSSLALAEHTESNGNSYEAVLTDRKTVEIKFTAGINEVRNGGITVTGNEIDSIEVNGTSTVTVKLKNNVNADASGLTLTVNYANIVSLAGNVGTGTATIAATGTPTGDLLDQVAPAVSTTEKYTVSGNVIAIPFTEAVQFASSATKFLAANDFKVVRDRDNKVLTPGVDFTADINGGNVDIEILLADSTADGSLYRVEIIEGAKYIVDGSDEANAIAKTSERETATKLDNSAPTAAVTSGNATGLVLTYSEALYNGTTAIADGTDITTLFTATDVSGGASAIAITSATYNATAKTVTFVLANAETADTITVNSAVKDSAGNAIDLTTDVATFGGTTWTLN